MIFLRVNTGNGKQVNAWFSFNLNKPSTYATSREAT